MSRGKNKSRHFFIDLITGKPCTSKSPQSLFDNPTKLSIGHHRKFSNDIRVEFDGSINTWVVHSRGKEIARKMISGKLLEQRMLVVAKEVTKKLLNH